MSKAKLLVVEDDPNLGDILQEYLQMKGYDTTLCRDGEEGWNKFKKDKFDLCLLDVMMPGVDGLESCRRFKQSENFADIPVIFVTSMSDTVNEERGLDAGAVDYIIKPISPPIVKARVKIHIQNYLSKRFLENLLANQETSLDDTAKEEAQSLLVFF